ncbi:MAG: protein-disulfide reductase DsbD family protein [Deltaproteobacteria bacterium]
MKDSCIVLFFIIAFSVLISPRLYAGDIPSPVEAKLISDASAIKPGSSFRMGVLLDIDPRWHVYWKNSGDSGLPTRVKFSLPEGFQAGELMWPLPTVFRAEGGIVDYGYEDSLLLFAYVSAPLEISPDSEVKLAGEVSWVSCREICIPGRAELELLLPVSQDVKEVNSELFKEWKAKLPINEFDEDIPFNIEVNTAKKENNLTAVNILLDADTAVTDIELYPVPGNTLVVDNIKITPQALDEKTTITFDVKQLPGRESSQTELDTLIVFTDGSGKRSGVSLPVLLENTN